MHRPDTAGWHAWHLFYHGDRDRLLREAVGPLAAALWAEGKVTGFYLVRYALGGPHIRLRLRPAPGCAGAVNERVRSMAGAFFARVPSTAPVTEEAIRRQNSAIVSSDPLAVGLEDLVHPDNSIAEFPVGFEVERYGGPALFGNTLDFFALSSAAALRLLATHKDAPPGQRLTQVFRLMAGVAWGLSRGRDDFAALTRYALQLFSATPLTGLIAHGDAAFERNRDAYIRCLRTELEVLISGEDFDAASSPQMLAGAARAFVYENELPTRNQTSEWRIRASQLHMTANRVGLLNPEEFYLSHLLSRAASELATEDPGFWRELWALHDRGSPPTLRLRDRVSPAMAELLSLCT